MSILNKLVLIAIFLMLSVAASGDGIWNPAGTIGMWGFDGISNGQAIAIPPIPPCGTGVIDLTTGCTQGVFGGL